MTRLKSAVLAGLIAGFAVASPVCAAEIVGPTVYNSFADNPFGGLGFEWSVFEDFEADIDLPGVNVFGTVQAGGVPIDGPDGKALKESQFITFSFDANQLPNNQLPTHVGIVWTDHAEPSPGESLTLTFSIFKTETQMVEQTVCSPFGCIVMTLPEIVVTTLATIDFAPDLISDFDYFFGARDAGGISSFMIGGAIGAGIGIDHVFYGRLADGGSAPSPGALALLGLGLLGFGAMRRRLY